MSENHPAAPPTKRPLTYSEQREIAYRLLNFHGVFYKFWDLVRPSFTKNDPNNPTACVIFNRDGNCLDFLIDEDFWAEIPEHCKDFVICHEVKHVLLKHGLRAKSLLARINAMAVNYALDIPINEGLVKYFGFDRSRLGDLGEDGAWIDTVFEDASKIAADRNFEYYFEKIKEESKNGKGKGDAKSSDHSYLIDLSDPEAQEMLDNFMDGLSDEEKEKLKEIGERSDRNNQIEGKKEDCKEEAKDGGGTGRGSEMGQLKKTVGPQKPKPKKKWESIIKRWAQKYCVQTKEEDHWLDTARRNSLLKTDLMLPNMLECETRRNPNDKIDVWFFQDTSGSCVHLAERFFKAARSIPKEKFNIHMFCFDTKVFKLSDEDIAAGKLYGFGGTYFHILEEYIQQEIKKENKKYPDAVFVITDGMGDNIYPQIPKRWYWFLSADYTYCIPNQSYKFMLNDFE